MTRHNMLRLTDQQAAALRKAVTYENQSVIPGFKFGEWAGHTGRNASRQGGRIAGRLVQLAMLVPNKGGYALTQVGYGWVAENPAGAAS